MMKKILTCLFVASVTLVSIQGVYAQGLPTQDTGYELEKPNLPGTSEQNHLIKCGNQAGAGQECDWNDLIKLVQDLFNLVIALSTFVAAGTFMYAGFLLITAAGSVDQIGRAKAVFRRVLVGYLILFMAYIIVQQTLKYLKLSKPAQDVIGKFINIPANNSN